VGDEREALGHQRLRVQVVAAAAAGMVVLDFSLVYYCHVLPKTTAFPLLDI
jgi:hypothetical protein